MRQFFVWTACFQVATGEATSEQDVLVAWLKSYVGTPDDRARKTAATVCEGWPGEGLEVERRQKALQYLQLVEFTDIHNNTEWMDGFDPRERRLSVPDECGSITRSANKKCYQPVTWGHKWGVHDPNADRWYEDFEKFVGVEYLKGSLEDWQKFYFCVLDEERHCGLPPCRCTYPPCDVCRAPRKEEREARKNARPATAKDLGFEKQCIANPGCLDIDGDCCPNHSGKMETCCSFVPDFGYKPPVFEQKPAVPEEEVEAALDGGHYLGPLKNTYCKTPRAAVEAKHSIKVTECSGMCTASKGCDLFTFLVTNKDKGLGQCKLYSQKPLKCDARHASDGSLLYVKNREGMHPHKLPDRTVNLKEASFLALGDWGSLTCPSRSSMHYKTFRPPNSDKWIVDHNAQENVGNTMEKVAKITKPFLLLNVGDNFYWGGIPHTIRGGRGVHDQQWNLGFEMVYTSDELTIPWIGVVGNHDYGGDGCFSDIRAQFDYTIKDMLQYNRWKMPSPYYTHLVKLDGFSIEYFMVDSNFEDSANGRHGGICAQHLCPDLVEEGEPEKMIDEKVCQQWFKKLYTEQETWLPSVLAESTADWKILGIHHKPMGFIEKQVMPPAVKFGVQLVIAGHTHETAVYSAWPEFGKNKRALMVVGQGGGSQGIPGCGKAELCGSETDYSFANLKVNKDFMTVTIHRYDEVTLGTYFVDKEGKLLWEKPAGAPEPIKPLKTGEPIPQKKPRPQPSARRTFKPFKPLPAKKWPKPTVAPVDKTGDCVCDYTGTVNGVVTDRPGCAAHLGRGIGDFCYISGKTCSGARFSRKLMLHWRKCSSDEKKAAVV